MGGKELKHDHDCSYTKVSDAFPGNTVMDGNRDHDNGVRIRVVCGSFRHRGSYSIS